MVSVWGWNCHCPYFLYENTVAQKVKLIAHDFITWSVSKPGFKPKGAWHQHQALGFHGHPEFQVEVDACWIWPDHISHALVWPGWNGPWNNISGFLPRYSQDKAGMNRSHTSPGAGGHCQWVYLLLPDSTCDLRNPPSQGKHLLRSGPWTRIPVLGTWRGAQLPLNLMPNS